MEKALILEGWYNTPQDNWYPWLKKELEKKGYEVFVPDLPTIHTNLPDMKKQIKFIENFLKISKDTIIIGHSLGAVLALRLAEKYKYAKMFLIAGWDFDDLTPEHKLFWPNKIDHSKIKNNVKDIFVFSSDNDPYTTAITARGMSKRLRGKFVLVKGACHFSEKEGGITKIPQLLPYL
jgi:predicted alpha/beta hydrolase family esterase